jgi:2-polyprenyl-6-methoxyphenol hydroxylase-like FAD-dependent oxidoreductase
MPQTTSLNSKLRVAIIGAGPAGLGAAIEFGKLPFVDWTIYEQATAIREIGAGISIQPTTWRLVEVMGAAKNLVPEDYYQPADHHAVQHRLVVLLPIISHDIDTLKGMEGLENCLHLMAKEVRSPEARKPYAFVL